MRNYSNLHTRSSLGTCSRSSVTSPSDQTLFFHTRPFSSVAEPYVPLPSLPPFLLFNSPRVLDTVNHLLNPSRIQRNESRAQVGSWRNILVFFFFSSSPSHPLSPHFVSSFGLWADLLPSVGLATNSTFISLSLCAYPCYKEIGSDQVPEPRGLPAW